jgi:hypothetical protein
VEAAKRMAGLMERSAREKRKERAERCDGKPAEE